MTCDYCDEGNVAVEGWHVYLVSSPVDDSSYRVPCARESWCGRPGHEHLLRLCPDEDEAVGDLLDGDET